MALSSLITHVALSSPDSEAELCIESQGPASLICVSYHLPVFCRGPPIQKSMVIRSLHVT